MSRGELFQRHAGNPILTAADWPYPVNAVFNPAATTINGGTVLHALANERTGASNLTTAPPESGTSEWTVEPGPLPSSDVETAAGRWAFEDARIVRVKALRR